MKNFSSLILSNLTILIVCLNVILISCTKESNIVNDERSSLTSRGSTCLPSGGFSFPFGSDRIYSEPKDGDGWYNAQGLIYNSTVGGIHCGQDWNIETGGNDEEGLPCYAIAEGEVVYSADAGSCWGNVIIVRHNSAYGYRESMYGHLKSRIVNKGDCVLRRQLIGNIGGANYVCNGSKMNSHLHLELRNPDCPDYGSPGNGYRTVLKGFVNPSSFIGSNNPLTTPILIFPSSGQVYPLGTKVIYTWKNSWIQGAVSRLQIAYSATSTPSWTKENGFASGLVYNSNVGVVSTINWTPSKIGNYYWSVRSADAKYTSFYALPKKVIISK